MNKNLKEYLIDKNDEKYNQLADDISANLIQIRKLGHNKLNYLVLENGRGFAISQKLNKLFEPFLDDFIRLLPLINQEEFFEDYCSLENEDVFWATLSKYCKKLLSDRLAVRVLQEMDFVQFKKCFNTLFTKYVLYNSPVETECGIQDDTLYRILNLLNSFKEIIIGRRFIKENFLKFAVDRYALSEQQIEHIWETYNNNKRDLQFSYLVDEISEFKETTSMLKDILRSENDKIKDQHEDKMS